MSENAAFIFLSVFYLIIATAVVGLTFVAIKTENKRFKKKLRAYLKKNLPLLFDSRY